MCAESVWEEGEAHWEVVRGILDGRWVNVKVVVYLPVACSEILNASIVSARPLCCSMSAR